MNVTKNRGFTLVEMLVAVAIFSMVMIVAVSSLVSLIDANKKARSQTLVLDNINSVVELMSRSLREGSNYTIHPDGDQITFVSKNSETLSYRKSGSQIVKVLPDSSEVTMTAPNVWIDSLQFEEIESSLPQDHPKVLITTDGKVIFNNNERTASTFNVQTSVAQRYREVSAFNTAGGQTGGASIHTDCPFDTAPGRVIVDMQIDSGGAIYSPELCPYNDGANCDDDLGTFPIPTSLQEGYYDIRLAATTGSCACGGCCLNQNHEEYYIEIFDGTMASLGITSTTTDFPGWNDSYQTGAWMVETDFYIGSNATDIQPIHGLSYPTPPSCNTPGSPSNSVVPICAAFEWKGTISTTPVDKEEI